MKRPKSDEQVAEAARAWGRMRLLVLAVKDARNGLRCVHEYRGTNVFDDPSDPPCWKVREWNYEREPMDTSDAVGCHRRGPKMTLLEADAHARFLWGRAGVAYCAARVCRVGIFDPPTALIYPRPITVYGEGATFDEAFAEAVRCDDPDEYEHQPHEPV